MTHAPWSVAGKTVLVTGATHGLGREAAVALARLGARVVVAGRDPARTEAARADVAARGGSSEVGAVVGDFASQASIRAMAEDYRKRHDRLDVLLNNAGGVNDRRTVTVDGIETTFAVNHLGPFLLTSLLLPLVKESAPARVVTVASRGHYRGTLDFDDLGFARGGYSIMAAYCRSKLANVLFASELARRLEGSGVTSNSLHPGGVATNIWSGAPPWAKPLITLVVRPFLDSVEKGAATLVELAASPEVEGVTGRYFSGGRSVAPSRLARDAELGRRLWDESERLVGHADARPPS